MVKGGSLSFGGYREVRGLVPVECDYDSLSQGKGLLVIKISVVYAACLVLVILIGGA